MRDRYTFSGHTDYGRRFCASAVYVGDTSTGQAVFAWKDGLWLIAQRAGRSTYYVATRTSIQNVARKVDTQAAREALTTIIHTLESQLTSAMAKVETRRGNCGECLMAHVEVVPLNADGTCSCCATDHKGVRP